MKKLLIISSLLLILGGVIFVGALFSIDFDFSALDKNEIKNHNINQQFDTIEVNLSATDVKILPSSDGKCTVVSKERKNVFVDVNVENNTLKIKENDERKWYDKIGFFMQETNVTIYLPKRAYSSFVLKTDTGDVEITDTGLAKLTVEVDTGDISLIGINADSMQLISDTGKAKLENVAVKEALSVKTDTGDISFANVKGKNINFVADTGDVELKNVVAENKLTGITDTGDIKMSMCDGGSIKLTTDTGDIKGTLASEKIFYARSNTGDVSVPRCDKGGTCELECDTGDIEITIAE